ncbi:hypothetical protein pVco7_gp010 [Vibrio phage pVco-7]|uniref:Uncharacterized protein n=1 Tax=Vibrio phage pVco-5 TaxID=1965485 RepID=A0A1W6JUP9_9CAUD|nr:hypothetical protein KNT61_gp011 [Vibrio phage pVco-5]ARM70999.1 hypothetical protein pVco5_011 [Vibrio phage pVco-5]
MHLTQTRTHINQSNYIAFQYLPKQFAVLEISLEIRQIYRHANANWGALYYDAVYIPTRRTNAPK